MEQDQLGNPRLAEQGDEELSVQQVLKRFAIGRSTLLVGIQSGEVR